MSPALISYINLQQEASRTAAFSSFPSHYCPGGTHPDSLETAQLTLERRSGLQWSSSPSITPLLSMSPTSISPTSRRTLIVQAVLTNGLPGRQLKSTLILCTDDASQYAQRSRLLTILASSSIAGQQVLVVDGDWRCRYRLGNVRITDRCKGLAIPSRASVPATRRPVFVRSVALWRAMDLSSDCPSTPSCQSALLSLHLRKASSDYQGPRREGRGHFQTSETHSTPHLLRHFASLADNFDRTFAELDAISIKAS